MERRIGFFDPDDDLTRVHVTAPKMLASQSRLADLGGSVIPEQMNGK